jgi:hypothetical protein
MFFSSYDMYFRRNFLHKMNCLDINLSYPRSLYHNRPVSLASLLASLSLRAYLYGAALARSVKAPRALGLGIFDYACLMAGVRKVRMVNLALLV